MNWQKVIQAMLDKAQEYQNAADSFAELQPGLSLDHKRRAIELRENAEFLVAGLE